MAYDVDMVQNYFDSQEKLAKYGYKLNYTAKNFKIVHPQGSKFWLINNMAELKGFIKGIDSLVKLELLQQQRVQDLISGRLKE